MNTLDFLRLVWPEDGIYLLAVPASYVEEDGNVVSYHKHFSYQSIEAAAQAAEQISCDRDYPTNVFFALATVNEDRTKIKKKDRGDKKVRGGDNSNRVRAFWLDLDVKADPRAYATQAEAAEGLRKFCKAMGLPKPYVVSSGGGLHVYWPLSESIDAATWADHSAILKALTTSAGLLADPTRTADVASILRPVGTYNWKTGEPRLVQVVMPGSVVNTAHMLTKLQMLKQQTNVAIPQPYVAPVSALGAVPAHLVGLVPAVNEDAAFGAGYAKPLAREVVQRCKQLMWQLQNPTQVPEPAWYAMIGCLRFADKARTAIHKLSEGHPQYNQQRTDDKIIQSDASGTGPTLCSTFAMHNPGGCNDCPFKDRIKTPLQTVRALEPATAPVVQVDTYEGPVELTLPPPPAPYKRVVSPGCDAGRIAIRRDTAEGDTFDEVVYEYDIFPTKLTYDERERSFVVNVRTWLPHEGWQEHSIPTGKFYDRRQLSQMLGSMGVMADLGRVEELTQYMVAYIRELQKQCAASVVYAQLGWRDEKNLFVLPDRVVSEQGVTRIEPSANIQNSLNWVDTKGDLESWKQIVAIYNRKGLEPLLFGFGVGFAAPLFRFTNFAGAIVSMVGERGSGKSSSALCANSIWGHKKMGWLDMQHDTWKAFYGKLGALNNLPATYDEITNLEPDRISDLAYAVTKGQGRQRLQATGQAQENFGNWNTMMLTTSNASLHSRLSIAKADSSAEASRIFEYTVPPGTLTKLEADENFDKLNDHFGLAGEVYAQALINRREWARERVRHWIKEIDVAADVNSSERFWSAVAAAVLAGFELSNSCGLTQANISSLLSFSVSQIRNMRGSVTDQVRTADSIIADYINSNMRSMLVLNSDGIGKTLAQVTIAPTSDKLRIRLERHTGRMYIDRADFRRFCAERQADVKQVQNELRTSKILLAEGSKIVLGKGTVYSAAQTHCWLLDFNHPALSGVVGVVEQVETDTTRSETA